MGTNRQLLTHGLTRRALVGGVGALAAARLRAAASAESPTLRLLCWPGYDNAAAAAGFTAKTGFQVQADYIGANDEIFLKLRAGGLGHYDLVTPGDGVIEALVADDLIQPLDEARLASTAACLPQFQRPAWSVVNGAFCAAPYVWGTVPMIVATKSTSIPDAWTNLLNAKYGGKIILTNDGLSNIMIWNRALGAKDPAHVTLVELDSTISVLLGIKQEFADVYTSDMGLIASRLAKGKEWIATTGWESVPSFNGYGGAGLALARPYPGAFSFCDNLCLVKEAPNAKAAYAFIDHMRSADSQVVLMNAMKRGTVNAAAVAKLEPYARSVYDYDHLDQFIARSPFYGYPPLNNGADDTATYVDWINAWETVNGARLNSGPAATPKPVSPSSAQGTPVP